jgi:hypothetical protein
MSTADRQQAHYFDELLGCLRAELAERIQRLYAQVLEIDPMGDEAGVIRMRRTIRALETEGHMIDRMREALQLRLHVLTVGA